MAAEIKVNKDSWDGLSKDDQAAIGDIVSQSFGKVNIVPHPEAAKPAASHAAFALPGGFCKLLCQLAASFGHAKCEKLKEPAKSICNTGVDAGEQFCESKCH